MTDYKSVISVLCKSLNSICNVNIKSEHFRLAKYNKTDSDVVQIFWNVLHVLSRISANENIVGNVKIYFARSNYKNVEFYCLPDNMSYGSRELLLAFSWLLAEKNVLESKLKDELLKSQIKEEFEPVLCDDVLKEQINSFQFSTMEDYCNYILWAVGKINQNMKSITEYTDKAAELLIKVHKKRNNVSSTSQLSIAEILYSQNPEKLKLYINSITNVAVMLDNYHKWRIVEKCYWNWMKSVLDEKSKIFSKDIELSNMKSFLKYLKIHKTDLSKRSDGQLIKEAESNFPRSLHVPESNTFKNLNDSKTILGRMKIEDNKNLQTIGEFLEHFL